MKGLNMKRVIVAFVLGSIFLVAQTKAPAKPAAKPYTCEAGPDEKCPTQQWYADYKHLLKLQEPYVMPSDVRDLVNGIGMRLRATTPAGFEWSDEKGKFVKAVPPPAPVVKQPPVPAPK